MPQLEQLALVYASQWFWLAIVLAVVYFGIGKMMLPKIEKAVTDRDSQISGDLAAAERAKAMADSAAEQVFAQEQSARNHSMGMAADAKAKAAKDAEARFKKADAAIAAKISEAEAHLASARQDSLASLEKVAVELAQDIVAKLSGASVPAAAASNAVKAVMAP